MIIAFSHPKGGVGKSLLAFNYSVYNQRANEDIIVVDLDTQNSITTINNKRIVNKDLGLKSLDIKTFKNPEELSNFLNNVESNKKVVIDTGGFDSAMNRVALLFADIIVTPVSDAPIELDRLYKFSNILKTISENVKKEIKVYVVINKVHSSLKNTDYITKPFESCDNLIFLDNVIKDRSRIKFSVANGSSVFEDKKSDKDKKAIADFKSLFKEIDNII
ncbi:hypothetical protein A9K75_09195 [Campylobacter fetus subsp. testudinum]|uniref:ParA family protein n=1 Tax=Campylobacter fetus TaxID=196 RepID=UPI000818A670|nr:ParA family protein [Campylobacter fetus]OCR98938.1 hypothetical protein A9K75_09195 [Campylobacter fetus subsp. testudinum]